MGRYSPTVLPSEEERPGLTAFLSEFSRGPERLHQQRADKRAREEYEYAKSQRPLEEAVRAAQLRELGITKDEEPTIRPAEGPPPTAEFDRPGEFAPPARPRTEIPAARLGPAGNPSMRNPQIEPFVNELAPTPQLPGGAYDPMKGGFTQPRAISSRIPLGHGYSIDEAQTQRGRAEASAALDEQRLVEAGIPPGLAAYAARHPENSQQILSSFFEKKTRPWAPGSMAEALDFWRKTTGTIPHGQREDQFAMPLDKAYAQIDQMFGTWVGEEFHSKLNPETRTRLAQHLAETGQLPAGTPKKTLRQLRTEQNQRFPGSFTDEEIAATPDVPGGMTAPARPDTARGNAPGAMPRAPRPGGRLQALQRVVDDNAESPEMDLRDALEAEGATPAEIDTLMSRRKRPPALAPNTVGQPR